jgi:hypothetical protein
MRTSIFVSHIIILCSFIRTYVYISHIITSCIIYAMYFLMTKIITRKRIAKKNILVSVCERYFWWNKYFELILMGIISFLFVIISFPTVSFIVDGSFENIGMNFRFFFIFLL